MARKEKKPVLIIEMFERNNMKNLRFKIVTYVVICLFTSVAGLAQDTKSRVKDKYQHVEVAKFDINDGVEFSAALLDVLMAEIADELNKLKKFKQVTTVDDDQAKAETAEVKPDAVADPGAVKADAPESKIRLSGTVTKYKPGSRIARYMIPGAGITQIKARIKYVDAVTGSVLFEKEIDGKVVIGFFGGDSDGASRRLAREIAIIAKKKFD